MTTKATEKIVEALTMLLQGYTELQESIEIEFAPAAGTDADDKGDDENNTSAEAAIVTEMRAALESAIDAEDYSTTDVAQVLSVVTEALEEIDPDVFETEEDADSDDDIVDDDDIDDDEIDDDYEEEEEE